MPLPPSPKLDEALRAVSARLDGRRPELAVVLGSGAGDLATRLADPVRIPYADVPGFPTTAVAGHGGELVAGTIGGRQVLAQSGRFHLYEGHAPEVAALPVRLFGALGVRTLILTNAAGAVRRTFRTPALMLIADHINLLFRNPLIGPVVEGEQRFPDMSEPYDRALRSLARAVAQRQGIAVEEGVYAALLGPTYETPAEVRMLERLGADAVGMSTVPEVLVARALGMRVAAVSCITNLGTGLSPAPLSHAEVIAVTERTARSFVALVRAFLARVAGREARGA
jgi:purine-nucleoside phosphorylase